MTESFDPFALPSSFDPLAASSPAPPRRRRRVAGEAALERPTPPPTVEQRLQALEDEVPILKARLDRMDNAIEARLDDQMGRIVFRVAEMLEAERLALVGAVLQDQAATVTGRNAAIHWASAPRPVASPSRKAHH